MASSANEGGLIPEQVWDSANIPERELVFGRPSGSAMPLVWAHAEHVMLLRSLRDNRIFGMPPQTVKRYQVEKRGSLHSVWRYNQKIRTVKAGRTFRIEVLAEAVIHWSADYWKTVKDIETRDTGLGVQMADLPSKDLPAGGMILFTIYWLREKRWENVDFSVVISSP